MKESEVTRLKDLKIEYESKLEDLKSEFEKASMSSVKEAMVSKGITLEPPGEGVRLERTRRPADSVLRETVFRGGIPEATAGECGIGCAVCVTWCSAGCIMKA